MKPIVLVTSTIAIFGAGFVAGHYRSADTVARIDTASTTGRDGRLSSVAIATPDKTGYPGSCTLQSNGDVRLPIQVQPLPENRASLSSPALPLHESRIEEQAQWEVQQWEIREGELAELEAMIQSMETAGLPEKEIQYFRELKEERAKAPIDEFPTWDSSPLERTSEELRADFAASLEQTDISETERKVMLEAFSQQFELTDEN
ncbi:MAG TPA: hypothetical protein VJ508_02960 [Saprospiraceae bacterium]|nr:hypothetical protein [Saprospiraceae bacterium]